MDERTARERVATLTIALKKLGFTDELLSSIKFTQRHRDCPAEEWVLTWNSRIPFKSDPRIPGWMRQYGLLKFAIIDGPAENSKHVPQAWRAIADDEVASLAANQIAYRSRQRKIAQHRRGYIEELGTTMREYAQTFAVSGENRLCSARELWPAFGDHIRYDGLEVKTKNDLYIYLDGRTLAFTTFRNYVRAARKRLPH
ncbi:MAG: hypothetical protein QOJ84_1597 [Bradyrhizobium sp.]|jgi:hypothetical protein|nr:hypothetical protein [Bradyrhizobium sp.]